jgi:hypothetical protein
MTDRSDRVRELAYFLWLEEGRPEGEAERHWLAAEALIESGPAEVGRRTDGELGERPDSFATAPASRGAGGR